MKRTLQRPAVLLETGHMLVSELPGVGDREESVTRCKVPSVHIMKGITAEGKPDGLGSRGLGEMYSVLPSITL